MWTEGDSNPRGASMSGLGSNQQWRENHVYNKFCQLEQRVQMMEPISQNNSVPTPTAESVNTPLIDKKIDYTGYA